jgi:hypothetical protein
MHKITAPYLVDQMITEAASEIEAIRTASGFSEKHFKHLCVPLIEALAKNVQRLPLIDTVFKDVDGAWKFGLIAGKVALGYAHSQMFFPRVESEERRILEPQCHFAAFACTMATCMAMVAQNTVVTSKDRSSEFHVLLSPTHLHAWLIKHPDAQMSWRKGVAPLNQYENAAIAARFIPNGLLEHFDLRVALMMFGAINPQLAANGIETTLAKVVRLSTQKVIEHYTTLEMSKYKVSGSENSFTSSSSDELTKNLIELNVNTTQVDTADSANSTGSKSQVASSTVDDAVTEESLMRNAKAPLREWFTALTLHERYSELKNQLVITDKGIEMPAIMLGLFGVQGPMVKSWMADAGMIVGRTANAKGIILSIALKSILFGNDA